MEEHKILTIAICYENPIKLMKNEGKSKDKGLKENYPLGLYKFQVLL